MITVYFLQLAPNDAQKVQKYRDLVIAWNTGGCDVSEVCLADYKKVTTIATTSLSAAWRATQHIDTNWTETQIVEPGIDKNHIRSSAIGDILQRGDDYFMILSDSHQKIPTAGRKSKRSLHRE